jgi:hypothetical protein
MAPIATNQQIAEQLLLLARFQTLDRLIVALDAKFPEQMKSE